MRWLVLADASDSVAGWAYDRLAVTLDVPGRLITTSELAHARWSYRLGDGDAASVMLAGGEVLDMRSVGWALNRIIAPPVAAVAPLGPDASYAEAEWHALLQSWLHELGDGAVNAPQPPSLSGPLLAHVHWLALAGRAGFQLPRLALSNRTVDAGAARPETDIWVVRDDAVTSTSTPAATVEAARRLAAMAGATLLRVSVDEDLRFVAADPTPDLQVAGASTMALLAADARARLA